MPKYRIAIAGLIHETNTFAPTPTRYADFDLHGSSPPILRGDEIVATFGNGISAMGGIVTALQKADVEIVPILWCAAQPGGMVLREAFDPLLGEIAEGISKAGRLDAIVLDLHGAMVVEGIEDAEYAILQTIADSAEGRPFLAAVLDFHGNISRNMVDASDLLVAYRTYPHVDMEEAGTRVAEETIGFLDRQIRPAKQFAQLPFLIPIHAQCTLIDPMRTLLDAMVQADASHAAITSILPGFPPADIFDCGPSILAYADDQGAADAACAGLLAQCLAAEPAFAAIGLRSGEEGVSEALARHAASAGPVIIVDTQDNPGAGATSDTMGLVGELLAQGAANAIVAVIHDPQAADQAHAAGIGASIELALGGKGGFAKISPLHGSFIVEALGDGRFIGTGAYYNNAELNFGPMALLRIADSDVRLIIGTNRAQAGTQAILEHLGLDPQQVAILGLKSSVHFLADFSRLTPDIIYAAYPGLNGADPEELPYRHLRSTIRKSPRG